MFKKTTAIFFLVLANIILLAHAVIPHHHHKGEVCFIYSHCQNDCDEQNHQTTENNHEHDGKNDFQCCVLDQFVLIPSSWIKQECKCLDGDNRHPGNDGFQTVLSELGSVFIFQTCLFKTKLPLLSSTYTFFTGRSIGLRAPPRV